ncbi:MAG: hypothetical protein MMC23_008198 [Stictis urceolatum]|nr:hypothetical protein [Stictis urceolata]
MSSTSLTQHLLSQHPSRLRSATNHPFLSRAGAGTLSPSPLCKWLVQDKHYQFAYVQFIGRLISKIDLAPSSGSSTQRTADDKNLDWKTLNTLLAALSAIKSEIEFYDETVSKYDLEIHMEGPDEVTRQYQRLFEESSAAGQPVLRGLVVLWATEHCYLEAWSFAKAQKSDSADTDSNQSAIAALHKEFIPNWTSDDFKSAVGALAEVADSWAAQDGKEEVEKCEDLWYKVLELETQFWPDIE